MNLCIYELFSQAFRDAKIIDTPARILLPGLKTVAPPGIYPLQFRIKVSPRIYKAMV
jgi:hypothetical protein